MYKLSSINLKFKNEPLYSRISYIVCFLELFINITCILVSLTKAITTLQKVYGSRLIIQRSTCAGGGGVYKLKNENGRVVFDKRVREELDRALSCYNIQLDNPIAILSQDTAKTMLFSLKPHNLYDFFMQSTQLKLILSYYEQGCKDHELTKGGIHKPRGHFYKNCQFNFLK